MKKLIYTGKFLTLLSLVILTGCKKDSKVDFPKQTTSSGNTADFAFTAPNFPTIKDADGILIAVQAHNYYKVTVNPFEKTFEYGMAEFTNTTGNFSSPVSAGTVVVDTTTLESSGAWYLSPIRSYSLNFSSAPINWSVSGAGSMPSANQSLAASSEPAYNYGGEHFETWIPALPRTLITVPTKPTPPAPLSSYTTTAGHPDHADSVNYNTNLYPPYLNLLSTYQLDSAKRRSDSIFNITPIFVMPVKGYTTGTDTLFIILNDGQNFYYERKILPTDSVANFTPNDFAAYPSAPNQTNYSVQVNAVKYSSAMVGSKKYYYLKMGSYIKFWRAQ
jgi:hypothetical protein